MNALREALLTDTPEISDPIPLRVIEGAVKSDLDMRASDDDRSIVADWFDDRAQWDDWEAPIMR